MYISQGIGANEGGLALYCEGSEILMLSGGNGRVVGREELIKPDECGGRDTERNS